jgi:hypothetical protein
MLQEYACLKARITTTSLPYLILAVDGECASLRDEVLVDSNILARFFPIARLFDATKR